MFHFVHNRYCDGISDANELFFCHGLAFWNALCSETPSSDDFEYKCNEDSTAHSISIDDVSNGTNYHIAICGGTSSTFTLSAIGEHYERNDNATGADIHDPSTSDTHNYRFMVVNLYCILHYRFVIS